MSDEELIQKLQQSELFANLNEEEVRQVLDSGHIREYANKQLVYKSGAPSEAIYLLLGGTIRLLYELENDPSMLLAVLGPGECFGESSLLRDEPHSVYAVSFEAGTEVFVIMKEDFQNLLSLNHPISSKLWPSLCLLLARRLRIASKPPSNVFHHMGEKFRSYHESMAKINHYFASNMFYFK